MDRKNPPIVNITKKITKMIDKNGNVLSYNEGDNDLKAKMEARARRLGLK